MEGYEALAACDDVNVVYVGTINTTHLDVVKVIKIVLNSRKMFHYNLNHRNHLKLQFSSYIVFILAVA